MRKTQMTSSVTSRRILAIPCANHTKKHPAGIITNPAIAMAGDSWLRVDETRIFIDPAAMMKIPTMRMNTRGARRVETTKSTRSLLAFRVDTAGDRLTRKTPKTVTTPVANKGRSTLIKIDKEASHSLSRPSLFDNR